MDTPISRRPELDEIGAPVSACLPGEEDATAQASQSGHASATPADRDAGLATQPDTASAERAAQDAPIHDRLSPGAEARQVSGQKPAPRGAPAMSAQGGNDRGAGYPDTPLRATPVGAAPRTQAGQQPPRSARRSHRAVLLAGVAAVAVLAVAGGVLLISPYNTMFPVPRMAASVRQAAASAGIKLPEVLAPAAALAKVTLPPTVPAIRPVVGQQTWAQSEAELRALHPEAGKASSASVARVSGEASVQGPAEPGEAALMAAQPPSYAQPPGAPPVSEDAPSRPDSASAAAASPPPPPIQTPAAPTLTSPSASMISPTQSPRPPGTDRTARSSAEATKEGVAAPGSASSPPPLSEASAVLSGLRDDAQPTQPATMQQPGAPVASSAPAAQPGVSTPPGAVQIASLEQGSLAAGSSHAGSEHAGGEHADSSSQPATRITVYSDPVAAAHVLRAAPMSTEEQVQTLDLVTQMGALVARLERQSSELQADVKRRQAEQDARLSDLQRRITLAEARSSVNTATASMDRGTEASAPVQPAPAQPVVQHIAVAPGSVAISAAEPAPRQSSVVVPKQYRIQAASPGLALLAETDRGGGQGAQLEVSVGDTIPGYGRVKAIGQKGADWIVTTETASIN